MLAGVSASDLGLLLRGGQQGQHGKGAGPGTLSVADWRKATSYHGYGARKEVRPAPCFLVDMDWPAGEVGLPQSPSH